MIQRMFSDAAVEQLGDAVSTVLEKVGILCQNRELLSALAGAGAVVDLDGERARFPAHVVKRFARALREEAAARDPFVPSLRPPVLATLETQVAQFYLDPASGERRRGSRADVVELARVGESLHPAEGVGHCLIIQDVPPLVEPLEAALLLAEHVSHPLPPFAWNVRQVDYLREMGDILGLRNWASWGAVCIAHPLRFDRDVADKLARRVREGVPTGITAMPVAGLTTPVTVEGFVAVAAAEHIAAWLASRALNPTVTLAGSMWGGTVDPGTGHVSYSRLDAMRYAFACVEFLERWCGVRVPVGGGEYCDARSPGLAASLEKAYKAMTIAAFTGELPPVGEGMLEVGKTLSPLQLLLDREYGRGVAHLWRGAGQGEGEDIAAAIGMESILSVGLPDPAGGAANYFGDPHTAENFRSSLWMPSLLDAAGWAGAASEERALERARARVAELAAAYPGKPSRWRELEAMRRVLERARAALG